jgi:hypothetical protein
VPKSLFGFDGSQLVGRPLSSAIDVFTDWKAGCGEELSLLELLVQQLVIASDAPAGKGGRGCSSWRVGVHRPATDGQDAAAVSSLYMCPVFVQCAELANAHSMWSLLTSDSQR